MKVSIIQSTHPGYVATKEEFDLAGGRAAGICYMPQDYESLKSEEVNKTVKRVISTKEGGHHSVYDHTLISFYFEDIPKALAMVLNNEKCFNTSEKSARYTKMVLSDDEKFLYEKWKVIFYDLINKRYGNDSSSFFSETRKNKLAMENARYLTSIYTPTSLEYTISYRNLNYIYKWLNDKLADPNKEKYYIDMELAIKDFCKALENTGYIDDKLQIDGKGRGLSIISKNNYIPTMYFGDVYCYSYKGSFSQFAQAQRHRTIDYSINLLDNNEFYVPPILSIEPELINEWKSDCDKLATKIPQGMMININEMGSLDNLLLKAKERKCSFAQLEIDNQTTDILKKYSEALEKNHHPRSDELKKYTHGSRCSFPDFECKNSCCFSDGITGKRLI